jgi:hypothetical protein
MSKVRVDFRLIQERYSTEKVMFCIQKRYPDNFMSCNRRWFAYMRFPDKGVALAKLKSLRHESSEHLIAYKVIDGVEDEF